ncbi:MAG: MurR/RpiR family transcriptional regulator [Coprobacillaceae bacterium]
MMNDLEMKIQEYMIDNDITNLTVKQIANNLFVSRALVYKVIKKMGFNTLSEFRQKQEQQLRRNFIYNHNIVERDLKTVKQLIENIDTFNIVYVIGFHGTEIVVKYFVRQLINLGKLAICITDKYQLMSILRIVTDEDLFIGLSNTGLDEATIRLFRDIDHQKYVITQYMSPVYETSELRIGVKDDISNVSTRFERETSVELMIVMQYILIEYRNFKLIRKPEED